jgi:hypothetical protein
MSTIHVEACEMSLKQFKYRCPFKCQEKFHFHGNGGDPHTNRLEYRATHCLNAPPCEIVIAITSNTKRKLKPKRK